MINNENYYQFPAVSNSTLSWLKGLEEPEEILFDKQMAYDDGNLVDAIITEPERVNLWQRKVQGIDRIYSQEKINMAMNMQKAFYQDEFCKNMVKHCNMQHISYNPNYIIPYCNFTFELSVKCKWDLFCKGMDMGGDIKSTFATTYNQFVDACHYFDYFRSRAWYMDIENRTHDVIIGISKKNYQIFKIYINKGDELYKLGVEQYKALAYKYFYLFGDLNKFKII